MPFHVTAQLVWVSVTLHSPRPRNDLGTGNGGLLLLGLRLIHIAGGDVSTPFSLEGRRAC